MKIIALINWKITYCKDVPLDKQPSDYCCPNEKFWMFKYFDKNTLVDVIDISAPKWIEKIEKKVRFHFFQTIKILKKLKNYDLIIVHGSDSAMLLGALKRVFHLNTPPIIVVDISSFHQADETGFIHNLCTYSSKAFDHLIYHTSSQIEYYKKHFPWLVENSTFINVGVDYDFWTGKKYDITSQNGKYIICVGYRKRDWNTLILAYELSGIEQDLYLIGNSNLHCSNPKIKVLPFIPIEELMCYIYNSLFSVVPLEEFNYSFAQLTILQQMALGIPIIAADVPALHDYIKYSQGVLAYKPYDIEDLCHKIKELSMYEPDKIKGMQIANKQAIKTTLNEKNMSIKFEEICEQILYERAISKSL